MEFAFQIAPALNARRYRRGGTTAFSRGMVRGAIGKPAMRAWNSPLGFDGSEFAGCRSVGSGRGGGLHFLPLSFVKEVL